MKESIVSFHITGRKTRFLWYLGFALLAFCYIGVNRIFLDRPESAVSYEVAVLLFSLVVAAPIAQSLAKIQAKTEEAPAPNPSKGLPAVHPVRVLTTPDLEAALKGSISVDPSEHAGWQISQVTDSRQLLEELKTLKPDVVLLDMQMPFINGIEALRAIRRQLSDVKVIVVGAQESKNAVDEIFQAGGAGYVLRSSAVQDLEHAVKAALEGKLFLTPKVTGELLDDFAKDQSDPESNLTPRQKEVLTLLAEGHSMKEVAAILGLSSRTVAFHKYKLMEKLKDSLATDPATRAVHRVLLQNDPELTSQH